MMDMSPVYPANYIDIATKQLPTADLLKDLLDFSSDLEKFELSLRSQIEVIDYKKKTRETKQRGEPLLNDIGVNMMINIVTSHLGNVFKVTNFTEGDVNIIAEDLCREVIDLLTYNYKYWNVKKENLSIIVQIVNDFVYAMLKASTNEGIRKLLQMIEKRETKIMPENEKRSILPKLGG